MSEVTDGILAMPFELAMGTEVARRQFHGCAMAEIERIRAELECARGDLKTAMEIVERNQKDADRYRWLKTEGPNHDIYGSGSQGSGFGPRIIMTLPSCGAPSTVVLSHQSADKVIDALIAKERT